MKQKPAPAYSFGFTAQGLGVRHAQTFATIFLASGDWKTAKATALAQNAFRQERKTSLNRLEGEIRLRLQTLTPAELQSLAEGDSTSARILALLAVFKRYRFIRDFAETALRPKLSGFDTEVR
ncbi:MAG: DUF1819 family protein, partial [Verrucomicrobia bacterium]|nr:DUF1819 family protein [Verrucomicrobiota bacterium]